MAGENTESHAVHMACYNQNKPTCIRLFRLYNSKWFIRLIRLSHKKKVDPLKAT